MIVDSLQNGLTMSTLVWRLIDAAPAVDVNKESSRAWYAVHDLLQPTLYEHLPSVASCHFVRQLLQTIVQIKQSESSPMLITDIASIEKLFRVVASVLLGHAVT